MTWPLENEMKVESLGVDSAIGQSKFFSFFCSSFSDFGLLIPLHYHIEHDRAHKKGKKNQVIIRITQK